MFSRRDPQTPKPTSENRDARPQAQPEPAPSVVNTAEPAAPPPPVAVTPQPTAPAPVQQNVSVVAAGDVFEGKLTTTNGVRVLGTVRGTVESKSNIHVESDANVEADITAENVTIAGTYTGKLNCNGRLEITASGRASGDLETGRILLHEGGYFEGSLHMKPPVPVASATPVSSEGGGGRRRYGGGS
jgi:cytoskeletal protein CcmA (bactofilin family)